MKPVEYQLSRDQIILAGQVSERLEGFILKLPQGGASEVRFYEGFKKNVDLLAMGVCGDFVGLMKYQLGDSWQWGIDTELDKDVEQLIYGICRNLEL